MCLARSFSSAVVYGNLIQSKYMEIFSAEEVNVIADFFYPWLIEIATDVGAHEPINNQLASQGTSDRILYHSTDETNQVRGVKSVESLQTRQ